MARLRDLQQKADNNGRLKSMAAATLLLETLDSFQLTKTDSGIKLIAYSQLFKREFAAVDIFELVQPLGDWLCSLPKGVWNDKIIK